MKEMKTLKFPNQEEAYEIVDAYAREQISVKGMPTVTADDNGKILRVIDGTWQAVSVPSAEEAIF